MRARRVVAVLLLVAAVSCGGSNPARVVTATLTQEASILRVRAELAATPAERSRGLSRRRSLAEDAGMLFLFAGPVRGSFWMKNTLIPLDIAFIAGGTVVAIYSMTPCTSDPCPLTRPAVPYDSALEVNAGRFARAGISTGATFRVEGALPTPS